MSSQLERLECHVQAAGIEAGPPEGLDRTAAPQQDRRWRKQPPPDRVGRCRLGCIAPSERR